MYVCFLNRILLQKCDGDDVPCLVREETGATRTVEFSRKKVGLYTLQVLANGVEVFETPLQFRVSERQKPNSGSKSPRVVHVPVNADRKSVAEQELEEVEKEIREMELRRKERMLEEQKMANKIREEQREKDEEERLRQSEKQERERLRQEAEATQEELERLKKVTPQTSFEGRLFDKENFQEEERL